MKILFPDEIILDGTHFHVAQDWEVPIEGFFIIAPKRDLKSFDEMTSDEKAEFIFLLTKTRAGMREALEIDEAYFFQSEDTTHGFHFWIFPRHKWMEKLGRKIQSVRPIMEYAKASMATEEHIDKVERARRCASISRRSIKASA